MTLDDLIKELTQELKDNRIGDADMQIIAAKLRAGQELADTVRKWDNGFISGREARKAVKSKREAYDAAGNGE